MKKKFLCINVILIVLLSLSTSVFAQRYAYSAGTDWGQTKLPGLFGNTYIGDFTPNVKNSWLHYSSISDVTAKISTSAFTKNYLAGTINGTLPRLNSNILFFNGHANPNVILFSHQGDSRYATGIYIDNDTKYKNYFDTIGLNNVNMDNVELVHFVGCNTGSERTNLLTKAHERGANVAIGFNDNIAISDTQDTRWLDKYNSFLTSFSILQAINSANSFAPNSDLAKKLVYVGNSSNTVYSTQTTQTKNLMSLQENCFTIKKAEIPFILNNKVKKDDIDNNDLKYSSLINKIKEIDSNFNMKDYKVTEHIYNEDDGNGVIYFVYYINGEIETNKVFMATVENNIIKEVALVGVLKENYSKIETTDESYLINKVNKNIPNIERSINLIKNTNENSEITSHYLYDYNDETLKNITEFTRSIEPSELIVNDVKETTIL